MTPTPKSRAAASAPSISGCGARSLPIASTTTRPVVWGCLIKEVPPAGARLRFLLDLQHLAPVVVAALRADAVRLARLLAVLAQDGLRRAQRVVRAAMARARLG